MGIKDLFEKPQQILTSEDAESITKDKTESEEYLDAALRAKEEFVPYVDFSSASNFALYGSAEKYYDDAIKTIYREYPYDGSDHELKEYRLKLNYLTKHVFDNLYPRTNGYVTLGKTATYSGAHSGSYGPVASNEYIKVYGGPQTGSHIQYDIMAAANQPIHKIFDYANKLETNPYALYGLNKGTNPGQRLSNLRFSPATGLTVEFWLKKNAFTATKTQREVIFDLWNGKSRDDASYGRLLIELTSSATDPIRVSMISGAVATLNDISVAPASWPSSNITDGWNHYAISISGSAARTTYRFYQNGDLLKTTQAPAGAVIGEVTGALQANLGALQSATRRGGAIGYGLLSGSLDEFRYWTSTRTSQQIGRNWFTQVRGGTNSEPYNTSLGVYFKFNEGVTEDNITDSRILDYSGRISNGKWVGYPGYLHKVRSTGSALVDAGATAAEYKDPIIYKDHPSVKTLSSGLQATGSNWDEINNASMINSIPDFIREMDTTEGDGSLKNIIQLMGSYFDQMQHLITALPKVRATSYLTSSAKPYPFATHLLESVGLNVPKLFVQANVLESISARDEDRKYNRDITEVKNLIYQNIYNNIVYIYKSKGTEKSIRNLVRCFGIDEEIVRLNLYSSNTTYELKQNTRTKTTKTKFINFNDPDKWAANVYQFADPSNADTVGFITGSGVTTVTASLGNEELNGMTAEVELLLPTKLTTRDHGYFATTFITSSIFGMHSSDATTLTVPSPDYANFQVVAIRPNPDSKDAYFKLQSSATPKILPDLSSDLFLDAYTNKKWNISVRVRPTVPVPAFTTGSLVSPTYDVHFYGVNVEGGMVANSFHVSGTVEGHVGRNLLRSSKRLYVGAQRQNFKGGTLLNSDVAISSLKYWASFLDNADLKSHALDPDNYGVTDPYKNLNLYSKKLGGIRVPKIETLALNWTFDNVTGPSSDAGDTSTKDSFFYVDDYSSGSAQMIADDRYGWMTPILKRQHSGKGDNFLPPESGDSNPVDVKYISAARQQAPEILNTADAIQILRQDDDKFTREHGIVEHHYTIEKSMYQTVSEEMINMFSSVIDFNNLIGNPVNRYRQEYKDLSKLRQLFYERIGNTPDLDRYIDFYKWIDSALSTAIEQLIPASADVADELYNIVESHVLERNKYWTKFPTIEFKQGDPESGARGVHELTYDWKHGHAPLDNKESSNELYWRDRAIRTDEQLKSGQAGVDTDKEELRKKKNQHRNDNGSTLAQPTGVTYTGRTYALKRFTKPYRFSVEDSPEYRTGVNLSGNNRRDLTQAALETGAALTVSSSNPLEGTNLPGLPTNVIVVDGAKIENFRDVKDNPELSQKKYYKGEAIYGKARAHDQRDDNTYAVTTIARGLPARVVSSSVQGGYNSVWVGTEGMGSSRGGFITGSTITNIHHDTYGRDQEIPLQGPFTNKYVGGKQSRHVRLNPGADSFANRPEEWRILVGKAGTPTPAIGAFGFVAQDYPYPDLGQDPVAATGRLVFPNGGPTPVDGRIITISDGTTAVVFEFDTNSTITAGRTAVDVSSASNGIQVAIALETAINSVSGLNIQVSRGDNVIGLTNTHYGAPTSKGNAINGSKGNIAITTTLAAEEISTLLGMTGGKDPILLNYHAPKATRYREELIKRPVNIKNILQTSSSVDVALSGSRTHGQIGNYSHNYEIVQTSPRSVNDLYFRKNLSKINSRTEVDFLRPRIPMQIEGPARGAGELDRSMSSLNNFTLPDRNTVGKTNKTVIVSRFSAPGGFESISRGYLDSAHEEFSPNNVTTFRNRSVRGIGQWVTTSGSVKESPYSNSTFAQLSHPGAGFNEKAVYRVYDIHGEPYGLRTHNARWTARFGRDSVKHPQLSGIGQHVPGEHYEEQAGMHKVHRNRTIVNKESINETNSLITTGVGSTHFFSFRHGGAAYNANNTRLTVDDFKLDGSTQVVSLAMWIRLSALLSNKATIFQCGAQGYSDYPKFAFLITGDNKIRFAVFNQTNTAVAHWTTSAALAAETTYNLIVTYDGTSASNDPIIFINGVKYTTASGLTRQTNSSAALTAFENDDRVDVGGGRSNGVHSAFYVPPFLEIAETALWTSKLSNANVGKVYSSGFMTNLTSSAIYDSDEIQELAAWWRFGDDTSDNRTALTDGSVVFANATGAGKNPLSIDGNRSDGAHRNGTPGPVLAAATVQQIVRTTTKTQEHKFDNYHVQHGLPRNHENYSWILKATVKPNIPSGLPTASNAIQFVTESNAAWSYAPNATSSWGERIFSGGSNRSTSWIATDHAPDIPYKRGGKVDFVGLNTVIVDPVDTSTNTVGYAPGTGYLAINDQIAPFEHNQYINKSFIQATFLGAAAYAFHGLIHNRQGPYGWPSWKQIRGSQHAVVRAQIRNSEWSYILPDADELVLSSSSGQRVLRPRHGKTHHHTRITPVTSKYIPLRTTIGVTTEALNKFGKRHSRELPIDIQTPYGNELTYFNKELVNKQLNLAVYKVPAYDEIKAMYTRGALETSLSPVTNIKKFVYSEIIWPKHENMYMSDVREKKNYTNNFWVGSQQDRVAREPLTIHKQNTYGRDATYAQGLPAGRVRGGASIWPLDPATGSVNNSPSTTGTRRLLIERMRWINADDKSDLVGLGEGELVNRWSYPAKWTTGLFDKTGGLSRMELEAGPLLSLPHYINATSSISSPTQPPLTTVGHLPASVNPSGQEILGIKVVNDSNWAGYSNLGGHSVLFQTTAYSITTGSEAIMPLHNSANWLGYVPIGPGYVDWQAGKLAGKIKEVNLLNSSTATARTAGVQTTKFVSQSATPWNNNYGEFKNEIRVKAKEYSVIPEFRMEDHIESYIKQKGGDFLAEQNSLFRMVGMPSGSSDAAANSSEKNFYKIYGTTDFMKHFDILRNDIDEHFEPSTITLQCNAYVKFNPYDGFYPAQRTLHLASALSASYGKHISYTGPGLLASTALTEVDCEGAVTTIGQHTKFRPTFGETANVSTNLGFRNFLTPLYAPGIMFNTIKSGIACDWPVFTSPEKIYKTRAGKSNYWALGHPNPEQDQQLHDYFDATYGTPHAVTLANNRAMFRTIEPIRKGAYAIRESYRQDAIKAALVPLSASVGGLSPDGLSIQGVEQSDGTYNAGFYTAKLHVGDIPGLADMPDPVWTFTSASLGGSITKVTMTFAAPPPENMGRWDKRIPFEAIINPVKYMANQDLYDYMAHPSASMDVTASWDGTGDNLYSLMTNNFLAAVPEFFLANSNFTTIASRPQDELSLFAQAGEVYGMRVKMYRSLNRERNYQYERSAPLTSASYEVPQDPRDDKGLHETFTMYSRSSAFGFPIFGRVHCVRDEAGTFTAQDGKIFTTASAGIAHNLGGAATPGYSNMDRPDIFQPLGRNNPSGKEYQTSGTQIINATLFHTSSRLASQEGVLDSLEGYNWSYTPPYMHGEAWCDIVFAPSTSRTYSLAEVLESSKIIQRRVDPGFRFPTGSTGTKEPQFIPNGYHSQSLYSAENINANAMQLDSCLNLFGIGKVKTFAYSDVGQTGMSKATTRKRTVGDSPAWIIQPKFETPMFNFSPLPASKGGTCPRPLTDDLITLPRWGSGSVARGMWHQFGVEPQGDEGIWLKAGDIPKNWLDNHPDVEYGPDYAPYNASGSFALHKYKRKNLGNTMKSLTDFVGMDATPVRLGQVKEKITVSEALVAVPFVEKDNQRWFFTIDSHMVDVALGEEEFRMSDQSDTPGESIESMIRKMNKYVFPPVLDFVRNREIDAVAMYIFEFSMSFDKDDLSYIWQNLMPPSASGFKTASSSITHSLLSNELMGYANKSTGKPIQDKVQWMVFKVKQRAPINYYDKVIKSTPELDTLAKQARSMQVRLGTAESATYSYNWPYDHFSIIEMAQIKAEVEFSELPDNTPTAVRIGGDGGVPTKKGQYSKNQIPGHGLIGPVNPGFGSAGGGSGASVDPNTLQLGPMTVNPLGNGLGSLLGTGQGPRVQGLVQQAPGLSSSELLGNNYANNAGVVLRDDPNLGGLVDGFVNPGAYLSDMLEDFTYLSPGSIDGGPIGGVAQQLGGSVLSYGGSAAGSLSNPTSGLQIDTNLAGDVSKQTDAGEAMGSGFSWLSGGPFY